MHVFLARCVRACMCVNACVRVCMHASVCVRAFTQRMVDATMWPGEMLCGVRCGILAWQHLREKHDSALSQSPTPIARTIYAYIFYITRPCNLYSKIKHRLVTNCSAKLASSQWGMLWSFKKTLFTSSLANGITQKVTWLPRQLAGCYHAYCLEHLYIPSYAKYRLHSCEDTFSSILYIITGNLF